MAADNGRGFDMNSTHPDSLGLGIMRDRARDVGADISIKSVVGQGSVFYFTLPWQPAGAAS